MLLQLSWGQLQRNQLHVLSTQTDRLVFLHAPKCVDRFARQCYYKPSIRISPDFTVLILKPLKLDWSDNNLGFLWLSEIHTGTSLNFVSCNDLDEDFATKSCLEWRHLSMKNGVTNHCRNLLKPLGSSTPRLRCSTPRLSFYKVLWLSLYQDVWLSCLQCVLIMVQSLWLSFLVLWLFVLVFYGWAFLVLWFIFYLEFYGWGVASVFYDIWFEWANRYDTWRYLGFFLSDNDIIR